MNYQKAVQMNFDHMGTQASEWSAVPVTGMEPVELDDGSEKVMPTFEFPVGYERAPSLYTGECCYLCGTTIKNVFWIQNDTRKWIMPVGSECVTHFGEGESGMAIAKNTVWEQNLTFLNQVIGMRRTIWKAYSKRISLGYGRFETSIWPRSPREKRAHALHLSFKKCLGKVNGESGNAAISRWTKKNRGQAEQLLIDAADLINDDLKVDMAIVDGRVVEREKVGL